MACGFNSVTALLCLVSFWIFTFIAVESAAHQSAPAPAADCNNLILNLADCLSFVTNGSTEKKPAGSCCSGLKMVLKTDAECLCEGFKNSAQLGVALNITKALSLPSACHVSAPSVTNCGLSIGSGAAPGVGKDAVLRPSSVEEEASASDPKPVKDNKRKRASASEDPKSKMRMTRKSRKNTIPLTVESVLRLRDEDEEEENDGSVLVARMKKSIDAPKAAESMVIYKAPPQTEEMSREGSGRVPKSLKIEDASHRSQQPVGISEWAGPEALRTEENAPSESLGAIVIGDLPTLPAFSEWAIREAQALGALEMSWSHEGEDPFSGLFTGVEDAASPSDVSGLFCEMQQALNRAVAIHREACSRSRAELHRFEADLRRVTEERNVLRLLSGQREEEIKGIRTELAKAHQDQTDLTEQVMIILRTHELDSGLEANISISQLQ